MGDLHNKQNLDAALALIVGDNGYTVFMKIVGNLHPARLRQLSKQTRRSDRKTVLSSFSFAQSVVTSKPK